MTRLIDADKLREKWIWGSTDRTEDVECIELVDLDNAPTVDAVEVVRCKDCIYWDCYGEDESYKGDCLELKLDTCIYEDDFCSYGERKDDDR